MTYDMVYDMNREIYDAMSPSEISESTRTLSAIIIFITSTKLSKISAVRIFETTVDSLYL